MDWWKRGKNDIKQISLTRFRQASKAKRKVTSSLYNLFKNARKHSQQHLVAQLNKRKRKLQELPKVLFRNIFDSYS